MMCKSSDIGALKGKWGKCIEMASCNIDKNFMFAFDDTPDGFFLYSVEAPNAYISVFHVPSNI